LVCFAGEAIQGELLYDMYAGAHFLVWRDLPQKLLRKATPKVDHLKRVLL